MSNAWHIDEGVRRLRYDREGVWWADEDRVRHPRIILLFSRHLVRENGAWLVRVQNETLPVDVEDTPWHVRQVDWGPDGKPPTVLLNDETSEPLDWDTLAVGEDHAFYCRVKGGEYEARFKRGAFQHLLPLLEEDETGDPVLTYEGRRHRLARRAGPRSS